eukprot:gene5140-3691_t
MVFFNLLKLCENTPAHPHPTLWAQAERSAVEQQQLDHANAAGEAERLKCQGERDGRRRRLQGWSAALCVYDKVADRTKQMPLSSLFLFLSLPQASQTSEGNTEMDPSHFPPPPPGLPRLFIRFFYGWELAPSRPPTPDPLFLFLFSFFIEGKTQKSTIGY